jgi:hypothetical protein
LGAKLWLFRNAFTHKHIINLSIGCHKHFKQIFHEQLTKRYIYIVILYASILSLEIKLLATCIAVTYNNKNHIGARGPGYLFTKHLTTKIKKELFLLYTRLNATMPQMGMKVLLHAGILSFDHFEIHNWRIINALQSFKNLNLVERITQETTISLSKHYFKWILYTKSNRHI